MKDTIEDIERLENEFKSCQKVLSAFGNDMRQHILCIMLKSECSGSRVLDIAQKTNLSRPAVSHHMQILKHSGIVKSRKEGTCIYYYLDPDDNTLGSLITLFSDVRKIMENVPDRSGELI